MLDLDKLQALTTRANDHACDIARGRARWTMRIPADLENDSDLLITSALSQVDELIAEVRELRTQRDRLREDLISTLAEAEKLRGQRSQLLSLHREDNGRCTECVEWCDCPDADYCTHGNVEWPCRTALIFASASDPDGLSNPSHPVPDSPVRLGSGTAEGEASAEAHGWAL